MRKKKEKMKKKREEEKKKREEEKKKREEEKKKKGESTNVEFIDSFFISERWSRGGSVGSDKDALRIRRPVGTRASDRGWVFKKTFRLVLQTKEKK
jgi:hypothetical protein